MPEKINFKKVYKGLYSASVDVAKLVDVPGFNFLMIDGYGDPNKAPEFQQAIEALFSVSYALKFMIKKNSGLDYGVMPLEGLWWTERMEEFSMDNKGIWNWTLMIMQPEYVTKELVEEVLAQVKQKKKLEFLEKIRFEKLQEGPAAQIMHIGPYAAEKPTIEKLHKFIYEKGYKLAGKHREIYLSDFRKTAPERLKTIIRQPVFLKSASL